MSQSGLTVPAFAGSLARTLGRTSARLTMSTASAPLSVVGVRHQSTCGALRETPCVGRAWRGAGAERPVQNRATPAVFNSRPVLSAANEQAPQHTARDQVGRFIEPRCARNASTAFALPSCAPRSTGTQNTNTGTSALVALRLRSTVRPNTSLKLTRYGRRCKPGPRHMVHHRVPGLQHPPPRAA